MKLLLAILIIIFCNPCDSFAKTCTGSHHTLKHSTQKYLDAKSAKNTHCHEEKAEESLTQRSIFYHILYAILSGLAMNFMPCVLPVLSIKAISIAKLSKKNDRRAVRYSCIGTATGIVAFFGFIGLAIAKAKEKQEIYQWGSYLQDENYLMLGILLMFFVFGLSANKAIYSHEVGKPHKGPFFSGLIHGLTIPLLSTPCCGPFMGSVVALAVSSNSAMISWVTMLCMSIGLAMPYLLISAMKDPRKILPKPGKWMNSIKFVSYFIALCTVIWLSWLLMQNDAGLLFLNGTLLFGILLFFTVKKSNRVINVVIWLMIFILATFVTTSGAKMYLDYKYSTLEKPKAIDFDVEKLEKYIFQNKTVIVRFTADWCLTCKIMDLYLFNSTDVSEIIENAGVIYMVADITNKGNKEAEDFMKDNKIHGIPSIYVANHKNPSGKVYTGMIKKEEFIQIMKNNIDN